MKVSNIPLKLDDKDRKILYYLSENARFPYSVISKKTGIPKDTVKYRIENLEREGVIQKYMTLVDTDMLGYDTYHVFLKMSQVGKGTKDRIIKKLTSYEFVKAVMEFSGKYDFEVVITGKGTSGMDEKMSRIVTDLSPNLQEIEILIVSKKYVDAAFMKIFFDKDMPSTGKEKKKPRFDPDKKDIEILRLLSNNARMKLIDVAGKMKMSSDATNSRIRKMKESGLIKKFISAIRLSRIGYTIYVTPIFVRNLDIEKEKRLEMFLKTDPSILWAGKTIGKYNILLYIAVRDSRQLHDTIIRMRDAFPSDVQDYETLVAYKRHLYNYFPENVSRDLMKV